MLLLLYAIYVKLTNRIVKINNYIIVDCSLHGLENTLFQVHGEDIEFNQYPTRQVRFSSVTFNIGHAFDANMSHFKPNQSGLYWLHMDIIIYSANYATAADYCVQGLGRPTEIRLKKSEVTSLGLSHDHLGAMTADSIVNVTSSLTTSTNKTSTKFYTSWFGFRINNILGQRPIAFSVINCRLPKKPYDLIQFTDVIVNEGQGWNSSFNKFTAPLSGIYVFSFGFTNAMCNVRSSVCSLKTTINGNTYFLHLILLRSKGSGSSPGNEHTTSRTIVVELKRGVAVSAAHVGGENGYQHTSGAVSFKGFLYSPQAEHQTAAWSLSLTVSDYLDDNLHADSTADLQFAVVRLSNNTLLSSLRNNMVRQVSIITTGIYYVTVVADFICSVCQSNTVALIVNEKSMFNVSIPATKDEAVTLERASMLHLNSGDCVSLRLLQGTLVQHTWSKIDFAGILVATNV